MKYLRSCGGLYLPSSTCKWQGGCPTCHTIFTSLPQHYSHWWLALASMFTILMLQSARGSLLEKCSVFYYITVTLHLSYCRTREMILPCSLSFYTHISQRIPLYIVGSHDATSIFLLALHNLQVFVMSNHSAIPCNKRVDLFMKGSLYEYLVYSIYNI